MTNIETPSVGKMIGASGISWGWLLALGVLMTVLGVIGLGMTYWLTVAAVFWFGILTIVGGVGQLFDAVHHKGWGSILWHVVIGVAYCVAGVLLVTMPVEAAFWLTLFLAITLVVVGVSRIVMAVRVRHMGSVWVGLLVSGLISIVLGVMIYGMVTPPTPEALATPEGKTAWLQSWGWVIGLFVAVELLMEGLGLIFLAIAAKAGGTPPATPAAA